MISMTASLEGNIISQLDTGTNSAGRPWVRFRMEAHEGAETTPSAFFSVAAFDDLARQIAATFRQGDRILLNGPMQWRHWQDEQGVVHRELAVFAEQAAASFRGGNVTIVRDQEAPYTGPTLPDTPFPETE